MVGPSLPQGQFPCMFRLPAVPLKYSRNSLGSHSAYVNSSDRRGLAAVFYGAAEPVLSTEMDV